MPETHVIATVGATDEVIHAIYEFIANTGTFATQSVLRIVTEAGTPALFDGSSFGTPSGPGWWGTGSYLVFEPLELNPAGVRWQVRITKSATNDLDYQLAPSGSWTTASGFTGVVSTAKEWNNGAAPTASSQLYLSACDLDTYVNTSVTYQVPYFRCLLYAAGSAAIDWGLFAGAYLPFDPLDTKPVVAFGKEPLIGTNVTTQTWGFDGTGVNNRNAVPSDYAHSAMVDAYLFGSEKGQDGNQLTTYSGARAACQLYVGSTSNNTLGVLGPNTMAGCNASIPDRDTDANFTTIVADDILHRWNP